MELTKAASDVLAERARQVSTEGWTPEHDDKHDGEELAFAAACYATADADDAPPAVWPWSPLWWKPRDRRRNLVKAAALLLAEIERLDRRETPNEVLGAGAEASQCPECHGKGWNDVWKKVAGHYMGGEVFREECEHCEGAGAV